MYTNDYKNYRVIGHSDNRNVYFTTLKLFSFFKDIIILKPALDEWHTLSVYSEGD